MSDNGSPGRDTSPDDVVVRKSEHGWFVRGENVADLTSAIVLADLFAAEKAAADAAGLEAVDGTAREEADSQPPRPSAQQPPARGAREPDSPRAGRVWHDENSDAAEAARLKVTVAQLEHALASRVRVEQAIGVLSERHRLRPREAFDLLRRAARSRGRRVTEIAQDVVASSTNPLLRLPDELARTLPEPRPRPRGRSRHRAKHASL
jgi:hypothetical protein